MTRAGPTSTRAAPTSAIQSGARAAAWLLSGAIVWALASAASAALSIRLLAWQNGEAAAAVTTLFGAGALAGYGPAVMIARALSSRRGPETRFAAHMVLLSVGTIGFTALFFGLHYRLYYSHWHEPPFTIGWTFQYVFTVAAAVYHFLVLGMRMYLPVGLPALLAFSLWHGARRR